MMQSLRFLFSINWLLAPALPALGASPGTSEATVCIYHASKSPPAAELVTDPGHGGRPLGGFKANTPTVQLNPGDSVRVTICDYNPVLFSYSISEKKEAVKDVAAATQFATAIKTLVGGLAGKASPEDLQINSLSINDLRNSVDDVNGKIEQIGTLAELSTSASPSVIADKKKTLESWAGVAKRLQVLLEKLGAIDSAPASGTPLTISSDTLNPRTGKPFDGFATLEDLKDGLRSGFLKTPQESRLAGLLTQVNYLQYGLSRLSDLKIAANAVSQFATSFAQIYTDKAPSLVVSYTNTSVDTVSVTVTANSTFATYLSDSTKQFQKDKSTTDPLAISVQPKEPIHLSIAPGAVYSFIRQTKYTAQSNSTGAFTVAASSTDYAAVSGAVVVNLTSDKYVARGTQIFGQIGIAPSSGNMAFLVGAGLNLYSQAIVSFGVIYQEQDVLGQGLSVGSTLKNQSDLKLQKQFKFGPYIGLSFNLPSSSSGSKN